jgi:hypothetical protein
MACNEAFLPSLHWTPRNNQYQHTEPLGQRPDVVPPNRSPVALIIPGCAVWFMESLELAAPIGGG